MTTIATGEERGARGQLLTPGGFDPSLSRPPAARPITIDQFRATSHFLALDGLRGLSILAVIWHHTMNPTGPWGYMGVSLFFVISGFLITTLLLRERATTGSISLRNFYVRRTLRIFPLYYAVLAVYVVLVVATEARSNPGRAFLHTVPAFLTYTSNWFTDLGSGNRVIFYFAWSLATEEQFYLCWPAVIRFSRRWYAPVVVMITVLVVHQFVATALAHGLVAVSLPTRILASIAPPIGLGCLAAYATDHPSGYRFLSAALGRSGTTVIVLVATVAAIALGAPPAMIYVPLVCLVIAACLEPPGSDRLLTHRWLRAIGVVSYGMYLMHMLCVNIVRHVPAVASRPLVLFAATALLAFLVAQLSYRTYERWFLQLKNRFRAPASVGDRRVLAPLGVR